MYEYRLKFLQVTVD